MRQYQLLRPRAAVRRSYRNGLCWISVFLAAALKDTGIPRFVVLDDVTSSFDFKAINTPSWKVNPPNPAAVKMPKDFNSSS